MMTPEQRAEYRRHLEGMRSHFLGLMAILKKDEADGREPPVRPCPSCGAAAGIMHSDDCPRAPIERLERDAAQDDPN